MGFKTRLLARWLISLAKLQPSTAQEYYSIKMLNIFVLFQGLSANLFKTSDKADGKENVNGHTAACAEDFS